MVAEYLAVGATTGCVLAVCVLDPRTQTARIFYEDEPVVVLQAGDELTNRKLLEGFAVKVGRLFESGVRDDKNKNELHVAAQFFAWIEIQATMLVELAPALPGVGPFHPHPHDCPEHPHS